jgi:hypothetical protein
MVFDQRKLDFAGIVRFAQGPIAALNIRRSILHRNQKNAGCDHQVRESATHSHKSSPLLPCDGHVAMAALGRPIVGEAPRQVKTDV